MGIIGMFMVLATLTPFLFFHVNKKILALVQTIMLIGMWGYSFEALFHSAPQAFTIMWFMFYASMLMAEFAWILFIINMKKTNDIMKTSNSGS